MGNVPGGNLGQINVTKPLMTIPSDGKRHTLSRQLLNVVGAKGSILYGHNIKLLYKPDIKSLLLGPVLPFWKHWITPTTYPN